MIEWINAELNDRGWTQNELARRAGITSGALSMLMNQQRGAGPDLCAAIAAAVGVAPEYVFRLAGLLPRLSKRKELQEQLIHYYDTMSEERGIRLLEIAAMFAHETERENNRSPASGVP